MNIQRQPEFVEAFHYDARNKEQEIETEIRVEISPVDMSELPDFPHGKSSVLGLRIAYQIVFEEFVLTGAVKQMVTLLDRFVETAEELSQPELDELMRPLFSMIERMTYEVTEIALDRPGVQLNFTNNN
ncbi:DUF1149 family protein [Vagococcus intermedius]|uniref:DUF1149 family protein n=1 Tax=Vagococcus intermedius TaxID=2991418 RepID=A0AAF0CW18_9ENTE|nr:DUF1149 family protein [Vagococcus intermedius]WEG73909.1 DUF1149 family protein [Vagococcus intermedius]WEG75992.1 DUF1149 family protein [Vagococcus intermedius]